MGVSLNKMTTEVSITVRLEGSFTQRRIVAEEMVEVSEEEASRPPLGMIGIVVTKARRVRVAKEVDLVVALENNRFKR